MYACPSCNQPAITWWQKINATALKPVLCSSCGKFSATYLRSHTWVLVLLIYSDLLLSGIVLSAIFFYWAFILLIPILIIVFIFPIITPFFPLKEMSGLDIKKANNKSNTQEKFIYLPIIFIAALVIISMAIST